MIFKNILKKEIAYVRKRGRRFSWQIQVALALHKKKDVVLVAPTGAGKTLSFWIPLLMAQEDGIKKPAVIIVTPINLLRSQNVEQLGKAGITAVAVTKENNNKQTFQVRGYLILQVWSVLSL